MLIRQNTLVLNHLSTGSEFLRRDPSLAPRTPPLDPSATLDPSTAPSYPSPDASSDDTITSDASSMYGSKRRRAMLRDREAQPQGIAETAKEMWNGTVERWTRRVQNTDWHYLREAAEERAGMVYGYARREARNLERKAEEKSA